jgi:uncharacterized membrane protein
MLSKILLAILLIVAIDFVWIGIINQKLYQTAIEAVQKTKLNVRYFPGLIVYIAIALIVNFWIIPFVKQNKDKKNIFYHPFVNGFLLGFLTYAIFDFTNMAIFSEWYYSVSILDSLWGGVLTGSITMILLYLEKSYK